MSKESWDLVEFLKGSPVDDSPEAREARRVAGGFREMTPEEIKERASDLVARRLAAFDDVWVFMLNRDTSASANGYGYVLDGSVEGEWYERGAREVLDALRALITFEETGE